MNLKLFVGKNKLNVSLLLFLILFCLVHYIKPGIGYDENGEFRPFGVGYRHKTVIPIWLVAIITGIFSYLFILAYLSYT